MPEILKGTTSGSNPRIGMILIRSLDEGEAYAAEQLVPYWYEAVKTLSPEGTPWAERVAAYFAQNSEMETEARLRRKAHAQTGFTDWYDWSLDKWGTKWNAYSHSEPEQPDDQTFIFRFDTAWSFPVPVFEFLARFFPTLEFHCLCFDEGWNFAGEGCFNPGVDDDAFALCDATRQLYAELYGDDEADDETPLDEASPATAS